MRKTCLGRVGIVLLCAALFTAAWAQIEQKQYDQAMEKLNKAESKLKRFYALGSAAKASFNIGNTNQARWLAEELQNMMGDFTSDWNYGNAVQDANIVLGRIAVTEGRIEDAKTHLLAAGKSPGSPQMNSFGPNMSLANDLLQKGEKAAVLKYFKQCAKFWNKKHSRLKEWTQQVQAGQNPDFGANLYY